MPGLIGAACQAKYQPVGYLLIARAARSCAFQRRNSKTRLSRTFGAVAVVCRSVSAKASIEDGRLCAPALRGKSSANAEPAADRITVIAIPALSGSFTMPLLRRKGIIASPPFAFANEPGPYQGNGAAELGDGLQAPTRHRGGNVGGSKFGRPGGSAMAMTIVQTTISGTTIQMSIADDRDPEKATQWLDFEIPLEPLIIATPHGAQPLGDPGTHPLATIQEAALRYVRDAITVEIRRLGGQ
jgi:hypothetical protein